MQPQHENSLQTTHNTAQICHRAKALNNGKFLTYIRIRILSINHLYCKVFFSFNYCYFVNYLTLVIIKKEKFPYSNNAYLYIYTM